jgi:hypothetical protein
MGCSGGAELTKEEQKLKARYYREVAQDREYQVKPAGFSVRPVHEPFETSFMRPIGTDGIEFFTEAHMLDRDPTYYAGKLSTYFFRNGMYDSSEYATANLKGLVEHSDHPYAIVESSDSVFELEGIHVHEFHWLLVGGGTAPFGDAAKSYFGLSRDAEVVGAIIHSEKGSYLAYLIENKLGTDRSKGPAPCVDGWDVISQADASAGMEARFQKFLHGMRFDL